MKPCTVNQQWADSGGFIKANHLCNTIYVRSVSCSALQSAIQTGVFTQFMINLIYC